jgi:hypothetical protein
MEKLRAAILGPGKIGEFHAREFANAGCEVVAVLTTSEETAKDKAKKLKQSYGIEATPYWDLEKLLEKEKPDVVSICTPPEYHSSQIRRCLNYNSHVLCEKPLVLDSDCDNYKIAQELFSLAKLRGKILATNTQWISLLENIPAQFRNHVEEFSIYMEPAKAGLVNMTSDVLPHMNSFLIKLLGQKSIEKLDFLLGNDSALAIAFDYGNTLVSYNMKVKETRPRQMKFGINGTEFERKVEKVGDSYRNRLEYDEKKTPVEDPLKVSVQRFVSAVRREGELLVDESEALYNIKMQEYIIKEIKSRIK